MNNRTKVGFAEEERQYPKTIGTWMEQGKYWLLAVDAVDAVDGAHMEEKVEKIVENKGQPMATGKMNRGERR